MRPLRIPDNVEKDENATEMIRFWLANNEPNLTLLLGMWEDADDTEVDELFAWGNILSDIAQHVANGLQQSHGWKYEDTMKTLMTHFVSAANERAPGLQGYYPDEHDHH